MTVKANQNYVRIWETVKAIPKGKVSSYGQIADLAGLPGRSRLAGTALANTPKSISIPWYRVLRSSGQIAFPKGSEKALEQKTLLMAEGVEVKNLRVKLKDYGWKPSFDELMFKLKY
jgi:methylated-DNA-protein-cysteine methyltransferase-like protein